MKKKKEISILRSSAAEYLTFITATGESDVNAIYFNENVSNFVGNIEVKEIFLSLCDVVVCDGFVGNVALKVTEGTSSMLFRMLKQEFKADLMGKIIGLLAKPFMKRIYTKINYEEFGGALLLGVKGITVISHGRSKAYAIKNAVRVAKNAVETGVNEKIAKFYEE